MTKIIGNVDHVGPSGGVTIAGDYKIITYGGSRPTINTSGVLLVGDSVIPFTPTSQKVPFVYEDPEGAPMSDPGALFSRAASEEQGESKLMYNTGSGLVSLATGSGVFFAAHTEIGGSGIPAFTDNPSPGVIPWDDSRVWDGHFLHVNSDRATNTHIWVTQAGLYEVVVTVGSDISGAGTDRTVCRIRTRLNNTATLYGSIIYTYNRSGAFGENTATWHGLAWLEAGDNISVDITEVAGGPGANLVTIPNGCCIFMRLIRTRNMY